MKVKDHKRYIRGLAQANSTDNELDGTFKGCSNRSSGKCVPKLGEWKFVKRDVLLAGFPVLLKSSKNYCETGRGTIYFVDDGQNPSPQLSGIGAVGAKELIMPKPKATPKSAPGKKVDWKFDCDPLDVMKIRRNKYSHTFGMVRNGGKTPHQGIDL